MLEIYIDGASKNNPGDASCGVVMFKEGKKVKESSVYIGKNTNNFAEYTALVIALIEALHLGELNIKVFSDSQLLVNQIRGKYRVRRGSLYALYKVVKILIDKFEKFSIDYVPRSKNKEADKLANMALTLKS